MEKMAPEKIQAIFSECVTAQKDIQIFQDKLLSVSSEDRLKFQQFHQNFDRVPENGKVVPAVSLLFQEKMPIRYPMNEFLTEAESHYSNALLEAFMQFTRAVAENRPMQEIDLAFVMAFIDQWKTSRQTSIQSETARPAVADGERISACRAAIDVLIDLCDTLRPAAPPMA